MGLKNNSEGMIVLNNVPKHLTKAADIIHNGNITNEERSSSFQVQKKICDDFVNF